MRLRTVGSRRHASAQLRNSQLDICGIRIALRIPSGVRAGLQGAQASLAALLLFRHYESPTLKSVVYLNDSGAGKFHKDRNQAPESDEHECGCEERPAASPASSQTSFSFLPSDDLHFLRSTRNHAFRNLVSQSLIVRHHRFS